MFLAASICPKPTIADKYFAVLSSVEFPLMEEWCPFNVWQKKYLQPSPHFCQSTEC